MNTEKPHSPSCERNQGVILATLKQYLRHDDQRVLEVGSGTGQHAVYMGQHLPHVMWQTSDVIYNHAGINMWLNEYQLVNVMAPLPYEIGQDQWPASADVVFCANTLHIISEDLVKQLIDDMGQHLKPKNRVFFYGPFKYQGAFTSESNGAFDLWLKERDAQSGVRDFETINQLMNDQDMNLIEDLAMPANNQMLIFEKT